MDSPGIAIDYAAAWMRNVLADSFNDLGYEGVQWEGMAIGLFQYLISRDFQIVQVRRSPMAQ